MEQEPAVSRAGERLMLEPHPNDDPPPLGGLLRELAADGRALVEQEIALAKIELRENVRSLLKHTLLIGVGAGLFGVGLVVLAAFLVVGLGLLLGGRYWLSTLIIGGSLSLVGVAALLAGLKGLQEDELKPQQTVDTFRETRAWARGVVQDIGQSTPDA